MQLLYTFWSTQEELVEYFKEIWIRVNTNYPMTFMSDTTNGENEQGDIYNRMTKMQVFDVDTLQKPSSTRTITSFTSTMNSV